MHKTVRCKHGWRLFDVRHAFDWRKSDHVSKPAKSLTRRRHALCILCYFRITAAVKKSFVPATVVASGVHGTWRSSGLTNRLYLQSKGWDCSQKRIAYFPQRVASFFAALPANKGLRVFSNQFRHFCWIMKKLVFSWKEYGSKSNVCFLSPNSFKI